MSCCEKLKYERLKELSHATVLASQEAHIRNMKMAVVQKEHHNYGNYYIGVKHSEAVREGLHVLKTIEPGKKKAKPSGSKKSKNSSDSK